MAQLVISAAGAVAGFAIGGPVGAQVGWAIGSVVGSQFGPKQKSEGPRLTDLRVTGSEYGQPIPWAAGHPRVAGQVWWSSARREIATTTSAGKGGGGAQNTSYSYEVDTLFGLVDREIVYVARVWLNGKLIWTAHIDSDADSLSTSQNDPPWSRMTIYTGSASQLPDPAYEAVVGVGNAPAYRGRGSVFIEGLQLGNSGVMPNLTFEVVISGDLTYVDQGFLSQYEVLTDSTHVESTLGPDTVISGGNVVTLGFQKFGTGSLFISAAAPTAQTGTPAITLNVNSRSWRIEGWTFMSSDFGRLVRIFGLGYYKIDILIDSRTGSYGPVTINVGTELVYGGGLPENYPAPYTSKRPPKNQWFHWSVQYNKQTGYLIFHINGWYWGRVYNGPGIYFYGNAFTGIEYGGSSFEGYHDSTLYRYFDDDESALLYPPGDIAVPTAPFEAPPYAYAVVDPDNDTVQNVVEDLCARAGIPAGTYDATGLATITKPVRAFTIANGGSTRASLEHLASAYFFEAFTTDKLYFVPRAGTASDTIDADDLGAGIDNAQDETLPTTVGSDAEIMAQVALSYSNVDADYNVATEQSDRLISGQISTAAVQLALGFTSSEAKGIADAMVVDGYASRISGKLALPLAYAALVPTDVVVVPDVDGNLYRVRLVRRTDNGAMLEFEWVLDDATAIESAGITSTDYTPVINVALPGDTDMRLLDAPLMRDQDNTLGHYVAASSTATTWPGASINRSADDVSFTEVARVNERAVIGNAITVLGNWTGGRVFDEVNTVTVTPVYGTLSSSTRSAMLDDASINAMMVGSELIRFRTATLSGTDYILSGLLRGQKGTEWAMGSHITGEDAVLMQTAGLRHVPIDTPSLGVVRYYKGVTIGRSLASVDSEAFTSNGVLLKPLAPVDLRAERVGPDLALKWKRRTRLTTGFVGPQGANVPLGEEVEAYIVQIMNGTAVRRTITVYSQSATYTRAQVLQDFGFEPPELSWNVRQLSAVVGNGYAAEFRGTVPSSTAELSPEPGAPAPPPPAPTPVTTYPTNLISSTASGVLAMRIQSGSPEYYVSSGAVMNQLGVPSTAYASKGFGHVARSFVHAGMVWYVGIDTSGPFVISVPDDYSSSPTLFASTFGPPEPGGAGRPIGPPAPELDSWVITSDGTKAVFIDSYQGVFTASAVPTWTYIGQLTPHASEAYTGSFFESFHIAYTFRRLFKTAAGWMITRVGYYGGSQVYRTTDPNATIDWRYCGSVSTPNRANQFAPAEILRNAAVIGARCYLAGKFYAGPGAPIPYRDGLALSTDSGATWSFSWVGIFSHFMSIGAQMLALSADGSMVAINDGVTSGWTIQQTTGLGALPAVDVNTPRGNFFIDTSYSDDVIVHTSDGVNWSTVA